MTALCEIAFVSKLCILHSGGLYTILYLGGSKCIWGYIEAFEEMRQQAG